MLQLAQVQVQPLWLEQLQPASWRGVGFHVDSIEITAGDTLLVREYPFQDLPKVLRMALGREDIKFSAYVIGDDYHLQREALREMLHDVPDEGGVLIHPTYGALRCHLADRYQISEQPTEEGGIARFELTFVRTQPRIYPYAQTSTTAQVQAASEQLDAATQEDFAAQFNLDNLPPWARELATGRLGAAAGRLGQLCTPVLRFGQDLEAATAAAASLTTDLAQLVRAPRQLASAIAQLLADPIDWFVANDSTGAAMAWLSALSPLFDLGSSMAQPSLTVQSFAPQSAGNTTGKCIYSVGSAAPASPVQAQLDNALWQIDNLVESLAFSQAARAAAQLELQSLEAALALRTQLNAAAKRMLGRASAQAPSSTMPAAGSAALPWFDALRRLHTAVLADLAERSEDLQRLTQYTPETVQTIWYISYRLYGTAQYADEILAMNPHIQHPLLVPAGMPLRVVRHTQ